MLVSKRKRYLSGQDWVINTLDRMMKDATCSGNMSQIVLMLDTVLEEQTIREKLDLFMKQFPVLQGSVARDFKLTPYWSIPASAKQGVSLTISHVADCACPEAALSALTRSANSSFQGEQEHLAFHLFTDGKQSALAMTFDHRLFDARGAEAFLNLFHLGMNGGRDGDISFTSSMELTQWLKKFLAGRNVNRRIIALSKSSPQSLQITAGREKGFKYRLMAFSKQETSGIYDKAYTEAGYLLESPFFLSVITQAMHELFQTKTANGTSYLIPVTTDLRPGKDTLQEIFFNHVSYLFYQIPVQEAADRKALIALFKQQMYDQVKAGFAKDLAGASLLTRIAPLRVLGKLLHIPLKGRMATFVFSHLGKSAYHSDQIMGGNIKNFFHMPRVPVPPGLGFFSNYYQGRLNLVISHLDGLLADDEVNMLETAIRKGFGVSQA
jgi:hypothetical protein